MLVLEARFAAKEAASGTPIGNPGPPASSACALSQGERCSGPKGRAGLHSDGGRDNWLSPGRWICRALLREGGFTLAEVLIAMAIFTIGIVGVGAALNLQAGGVAGSADVGLAAITRGNLLSTGTMLAQERLEQIKNALYTATVDQITAANFPNEAYGAIAGFPGFRRTVTIQDGVPGPGMKTITVQVFFQPVRESGLGPEQNIVLGTIIARRP